MTSQTTLTLGGIPNSLKGPSRPKKSFVRRPQGGRDFEGVCRTAFEAKIGVSVRPRTRVLRVGFIKGWGVRFRPGGSLAAAVCDEPDRKIWQRSICNYLLSWFCCSVPNLLGCLDVLTPSTNRIFVQIFILFLSSRDSISLLLLSSIPNL